ncbi:Sec-independent protein translocase protein TatB [soil metagenome]
MGSLGFGEIIALAVLALFIFGPEKLPDMARTLGKTINAVKREANKTLVELKESAGLDEEFGDIARDAKELRSSLKDVRATATSALMGPLEEVKAEVGDVKAEFEGLATLPRGTAPSGKPQSGPGMADLSPTAAGAVPGSAPFDPDAA